MKRVNIPKLRELQLDSKLLKMKILYTFGGETENNVIQ